MNVELMDPPGRPHVEILADGRRRLLRKLMLRIDKKKLIIPRDFVTDYSSWPRILPGPAFHRIDVAGIVHDMLFQKGTWGNDGRPVSYVEANRIWFHVARAGSNPRARAGFFWAWVGRAGLFAFGWPTWLRYRRAEKTR